MNRRPPIPAFSELLKLQDQELLKLAKGKEYFIITTNVEHQFHKAGFPAQQIFAVQGDYGYLQCEKACHKKLYYNESRVAEMIGQTNDCKIPSALVPWCPVCGGKMDVNLRKDHFFVEDNEWNAANKQYNAFIQKTTGEKIVFLELGVGFKIIRVKAACSEDLQYSVFLI